jgi:hypothetical protein
VTGNILPSSLTTLAPLVPLLLWVKVLPPETGLTLGLGPILPPDYLWHLKVTMYLNL